MNKDEIINLRHDVNGTLKSIEMVLMTLKENGLTEETEELLDIAIARLKDFKILNMKLIDSVTTSGSTHEC